MLKKFILLLLFLNTPLSFAYEKLPKHLPVPGGVAVIEIPRQYPQKPDVHFNEHPVLVSPGKHPGQWIAVVGIALSTKPGNYTLQISQHRKTQQMTFEVKPHEYPKEHLKIANQRKVTPETTDFKRIQQEAKAILKAYKKRTEHPPETLTFNTPLKGRHSSQFGLQRILNGKPKNPHSGLDIAAPEGTIIKAPLAGDVIIIGDFFYSGKTVFLDHGEGLITSYAHLSKVDVQPGEFIEAGESIGRVGKTGRVTGAHLHWSVSLNGERVNPALFFES